MTADPHAGGRLLRAGPTAATARRALILLHGRGADPEQMIGLAGALGMPDIAAFAPEAAGRSWWPTSFLAPMAALEPWLGSALRAVERTILAAREEGFRDGHLVLLGFSQGGCLALEAAARRGGPLGGVVGLSAGLVGTADAEGSATLRGYREKALSYDGDLADTPVYLSCHEDDPHIPLQRVRDSERVLSGMGADVASRVKEGAGHGFNERDIASVRRMLSAKDGKAAGAVQKTIQIRRRGMIHGGSIRS